MHDNGSAGTERRRKAGQIATRPGQIPGDTFVGLNKFGEKFLNAFQVLVHEACTARNASQRGVAVHLFFHYILSLDLNLPFPC